MRVGGFCSLFANEYHYFANDYHVPHGPFCTCVYSRANNEIEIQELNLVRAVDQKPEYHYNYIFYAGFNANAWIYNLLLYTACMYTICLLHFTCTCVVYWSGLRGISAIWGCNYTTLMSATEYTNAVQLW